MDICTLILATTTTLQMCYSDNVCHPSTDGTKSLCSGTHPIGCPGNLLPSYECKRPDGSIYYYQSKDLNDLTIVAPN